MLQYRQHFSTGLKHNKWSKTLLTPIAKVGPLQENMRSSIRKYTTSRETFNGMFIFVSREHHAPKP